MGVFTVHDALRAAAIDAGYELGVFEALGSPLTLAQLAARTGLRPTHRLSALVDALVAIGALVRTDESIATFARGSIAPRSAQPMTGGWGAIADVIRRDQPLAIEDADIARRYQQHLVHASAPAARDVAEMLLGVSSNEKPLRVIDIGGGAGAYSRAMLLADTHSRVTLVDVPEVIELAREELAELGDRVRVVEGDARQLEIDHAGDAFDLAIVANVLHLHSTESCKAICASAARAIGAGGVVAIVDLRRGTLEGEMFALNMALYTEGGSVWSVGDIAGWMRDAGLDAIDVRALDSAPEMVAVLGRKPPSSTAELG